MLGVKEVLDKNKKSDKINCSFKLQKGGMTSGRSIRQNCFGPFSRGLSLSNQKNGFEKSRKYS